MKNSLVLLIFILSNLCYSQSINEIRSSNLSDNFDLITLQSYDFHGQRKVQDLFDYIILLQNDSLSLELKNQIYQNTNSLFLDTSSELSSLSSKKTFKNSIDWLNNLEEENIYIDKIEFKNSQLFDNYWIYTYKIYFLKNKNQMSKNISIKVYFKRTYKSFGNNTKSVWDLKIGKISY